MKDITLQIILKVLLDAFNTAIDAAILKLNQLNTATGGFSALKGSFDSIRAASKVASESLIADAKARSIAIIGEAKAEGEKLLSAAKASATEQLSVAKAHGVDLISNAKATTIELLAQAKLRADALIAENKRASQDTKRDPNLSVNYGTGKVTDREAVIKDHLAKVQHLEEMAARKHKDIMDQQAFDDKANANMREQAYARLFDQQADKDKAAADAANAKLAAQNKAAADAKKRLEELTEQANKGTTAFQELHKIASKFHDMLIRMAAYRVINFFGSIPKDIFDINVSMELLKVRLEGVMGSAAAARVVMKDLIKLDMKTPFDLQALSNTFIMLKNYGLEPTERVMKSLTDQVAKLGGTSDTMIGIARQLGQAWAKSKLQMQDMRPIIERGVPLLSYLSEVTGKTAAQILEMSKQGTIGRDILSRLFDVMERHSANASARAMDTLNGALSNVKSTWDQLADALLNSTAEGSIKRFFESVADLFRFLTTNSDKAIGTLVSGFKILATIAVVSAVKSIGTFIIASRAAAAAAAELAIANGGLTWAFRGAATAANLLSLALMPLKMFASVVVGWQVGKVIGSWADDIDWVRESFLYLTKATEGLVYGWQVLSAVVELGFNAGPAIDELTASHNRMQKALNDEIEAARNHNNLTQKELASEKKAREELTKNQLAADNAELASAEEKQTVKDSLRAQELKSIKDKAQEQEKLIQETAKNEEAQTQLSYDIGLLALKQAGLDEETFGRRSNDLAKELADEKLAIERKLQADIFSLRQKAVSDELSLKQKEIEESFTSSTIDSKSLSAVISGGESKGDYNAYNRGDVDTEKRFTTPKKPLDLSSMTIAQVMERQSLGLNDPNRINAAGKYQFIGTTLKGLVEKEGIAVNALFDAAMQERLFVANLPKSVKDFAFGKGSKEAAQLGLSGQWAAVENIKTGKSNYSGNNATITPAMSSAALDNLKTNVQQNLSLGMPEQKALSFGAVGAGGQGAKKQQDLNEVKDLNDQLLANETSYANQQDALYAKTISNQVEANSKTYEENKKAFEKEQSLAREGIKAKEDNALAEVEIIRSKIEADFKAGNVSPFIYAGTLKQAADKEYQIRLDSLNAERKLIDAHAKIYGPDLLAAKQNDDAKIALANEYKQKKQALNSDILALDKEQFDKEQSLEGERIANAEQKALDELDIERAGLQEEMQLDNDGLSSKVEYLDKIEGLAQREYDIKLKALEDQRQLLLERQQLYGGEELALLQNANQIEAIQRNLNKEIIQHSRDTVKAENAESKKMFAPIGQSIETATDSILRGQQTWQQAVRNAGQNVIISYVGTFAKKKAIAVAEFAWEKSKLAAQWLFELSGTTKKEAGIHAMENKSMIWRTLMWVKEKAFKASSWAWEILGFGAKETAQTATVIAAQSTQTGAKLGADAITTASHITSTSTKDAVTLKSALKSIFLAAKQAAAFTYQSVSAIPFIGWAVAPAAAAVAFLAVMALGAVGSAKGGEWEVGKDGSPYILHEKESVLPASAAEGWRNIVKHSDKIINGGNNALPDHITESINRMVAQGTFSRLTLNVPDIAASGQRSADRLAADNIKARESHSANSSQHEIHFTTMSAKDLFNEHGDTIVKVLEKKKRNGHGVKK